MNASDISKYITAGESETLEFKSGFNDEVIETISAFTNTKGGLVLVGIRDNGEATGVSVGKETFQKWLNEIKSKTQPSIIPSIEKTKYKGKEIISISVNEFPVKPVSFKGRYFKRVGNANHRLSAMEITDMNLQSLQVSWDSYPAPNKNIADLDTLKINTFIEKVNATGRFKLEGNSIDSLHKLKLISDKSVTNAAWLLFAKEPTGYNVHLGRFKTSATIIDDKMLNGTLFEVVEDCMKYLLGQIKVAFEITGKTTQRTEIFEYPLPALREIVLNAIVHRDYLSPVDIQIKIFDNQITFFNPGKLYGNLTIEQLKKDNYQAHTRNKLIAEAFYLTGDIEKYGTGFSRIRKEVTSYPSMLFNFEEAPNGFLVSLSYTTQKVTGKVTGKVTDVLTDNQAAIVQLMRKNEHITTNELAGKVKISQRKVKENISKMKEKGMIERFGSAKSGYWKVLI